MPSPSSSSARVANLLRLVHAVSHDLSNPLQALVLHATMGLEDAEPGSDAAVRHEADVEATRRMRTLLRALQGLATAGDRPRSLAVVMQRFDDLFGERYARLGLPLRTTATPEGTAEVSALVEESLLGLGLALGLRARRSAAGLDTARLHVRTGDSMALAIEITGASAIQAVAEIADEVARLELPVAVLGDGGSLVLAITATSEVP
jgi:signal transduction histidine kinase